uniref:Uncharacterized protein n=1 Tax=Lactuca sativa TaxID=4236 RepID=A0A9R1W680_LACSA|nr:hypothetical protein LSAT_V11C300136430 [Lactuca sativa]
MILVQTTPKHGVFGPRPRTLIAYEKQRPAHLWRKEILHDIMNSCIIMHNMVIQDECMSAVEVEMVVDDDIRFQEFIGRHKKIKDKDAYYEL